MPGHAEREVTAVLGRLMALAFCRSLKRRRVTFDCLDHTPSKAAVSRWAACRSCSMGWEGRMDGVLRLLGGPPRCGKTLLAQKMASQRGIGWLSTDTIRDVVAMLLPALYDCAGPGDSHDPEADLFFPYFKRVVESCSYLVDEYVIEGVGFLPRHVAELSTEIDVRAVFVGMIHVNLDTLLATEGRNRWHRQLDPATLAIVPSWIESWSRQIERECVQFTFPYVELSGDFAAGIERARHLLSES